MNRTDRILGCLAMLTLLFVTPGLRAMESVAVDVPVDVSPTASPNISPNIPLDIPRRAIGKPDFNGIWQVLNTANYDLLAHPARIAMATRPGPFGAVPAAEVLALGPVHPAERHHIERRHGVSLGLEPGHDVGDAEAEGVAVGEAPGGVIGEPPGDHPALAQAGRHAQEVLAHSPPHVRREHAEPFVLHVLVAPLATSRRHL